MAKKTTWPIVFSARLRDGRIEMDRDRLAKLLKDRPDCELEGILDRKLATRSLAQNRYYFGVILETLEEHTGHTQLDLHELFKLKFLKPKIITVVNEETGEVVAETVIPASTRTLEKEPFSNYMRDIKVWAGQELGCTFPEDPLK